MGVGVALLDGEDDALLLEPPVSEGMSAAAFVAHAVAAITAAMVEQARSTRPWGEAMEELEHRMRPG
ncbi:MAG: hypothetical protein ACOYO9_10210, partial [Candidatus Nanopelagicales bacterium]